MPNLPGEQLVNRHAGTEVRGALLQAHAGQEHSVATRVIPGAIGSGFSQFLVDAAQDLEVLPVGLERFERSAEFVIVAWLGGPPGGGNRAVREKDKRRAQRRASCSRG